jgi:hypothetical protein
MVVIQWIIQRNIAKIVDNAKYFNYILMEYGMGSYLFYSSPF